MAISRAKTWIAGEVLTASDLNGEFNNIINNALALISPLTDALDCNGQEIILDADADTSIQCVTDDQINLKMGAVKALGIAIASGMTFAAATDTAGQAVYFQTADAGGTATAARAGGALELRTGDGSANTGAVACGAGGAMATVAGAGGSNTGGASGQAGGAGGANSVTAGNGGNTNSAGVHAAGAGGTATITGGTGGNATAGTGNGGAGGDVVLSAGTGGTSAGGTAGADGTVRSTSRLTTSDGVSGGTAKVVGGLAKSGVSASDSVTAATSNNNFVDFATTYVIPANTLKSGSVLRARAMVRVSDASGADTLSVKLVLGSTALITTTAVDPGATTDLHILEFEIVSRAAPSASSSLIGSGRWVTNTGGTIADGTGLLGATNFATNGALTFKASAIWSSNTASTACLLESFNVWID